MEHVFLVSGTAPTVEAADHGQLIGNTHMHTRPTAAVFWPCMTSIGHRSSLIDAVENDSIQYEKTL